MVLKFYYDLMSQPSRALYLFLKATKINYVDCAVALRKGEHLTEEYATKVNAFKKVPCIHHDDFKLSESVAIFRYLATVFRDQVPDHWYPADVKKRARVDEFMEWQHITLRVGGSMLFRRKFIEPVLFGVKVDESQLKGFARILEDALENMENEFLKDGQKFLCGNDISIADLLGSCEVEQPLSIGYDVFKGRPKLKSWMQRVEDTLKPDFTEAHKFIRKVAQLQKSANL